MPWAFDCGSPVCSTHLAADSKDDLLGQVMQHVLVKHRLAQPSRSIVEYVVANCVTEVAR